MSTPLVKTVYSPYVDDTTVTLILDMNGNPVRVDAVVIFTLPTRGIIFGNVVSLLMRTTRTEYSDRIEVMQYGVASIVGFNNDSSVPFNQYDKRSDQIELIPSDEVDNRYIEAKLTGALHKRCR